MNDLKQRLKPFRRRVRALMAWHGAAIGACFGGAIAIVLAALDFTKVRYSSWQELAVSICGGLLVGALIGAFRSVRDESLADSIDRRAKLANRVGTAANAKHDGFADLQAADAMETIGSLVPRKVFPVKASKWHGALPIAAIVASGLFILGNTPLLLSAESKRDREELQRIGETVEKAPKPILERDSAEVGKEERELAKQIERFAQELQKARMEKPEALKKADELMKKAENMAKQRFEDSDRQRLSAMQILEQMAREQARKELGLSEEELKDLDRRAKANRTKEENSKQGEDKGLSQSEMDELSRLDQMFGDESSSSQQEENKAEQQRLQSQIDQIKKMLQKGVNAQGKQLTEAERKALEKQMKELQELLKEFKLSERVQEFFKKLSSMKEFKELMEMAAKLQKANQQGRETGQTEIKEMDLQAMRERLEQIRQELEEMAAKYGSEEAMKELIEQMKEALKNGCYG